LKTWQQLNEAQQRWALEKATTGLLRAIVEDGVRFDDQRNGDTLQAKIDAAGEKAERMQTPWFWHEYIMDTCRAEIESIAQASAEDSVYAEIGDANVVYLPHNLQGETK